MSGGEVSGGVMFSSGGGIAECFNCSIKFVILGGCGGGSAGYRWGFGANIGADGGVFNVNLYIITCLCCLQWIFGM